MTAKPFDQPAQLLREGRLPEAYQAFREAARAEPDNPKLLFNAGMGAYLLHLWVEAAEYWTRVKILQPDDISVRARLVQVQELLDNRAARDLERAGLYALHQRLGADPQNLPCYPRDQFQVLGWRVLALEYFELSGPLAVRYQFLVHRGRALMPESILSLGMNDPVNLTVSRSDAPLPGERPFHLSEAAHGRLARIALYDGEPTYDDLKMVVCEYIAR